MKENETTEQIIRLAMKIHRNLGPGLLENVYKECLYYELVKEGIPVVKEKPMPLVYNEVHLECGYRIDLLVNNLVVVEIKSVEGINEIHISQVLTYLKLGKFKIGLLLNFNVILLKNGIKRLINS